MGCTASQSRNLIDYNHSMNEDGTLNKNGNRCAASDTASGPSSSYDAPHLHPISNVSSSTNMGRKKDRDPDKLTRDPVKMNPYIAGKSSQPSLLPQPHTELTKEQQQQQYQVQVRVVDQPLARSTYHLSPSDSHSILSYPSAADLIAPTTIPLSQSPPQSREEGCVKERERKHHKQASTELENNRVKASFALSFADSAKVKELEAKHKYELNSDSEGEGGMIIRKTREGEREGEPSAEHVPSKKGKSRDKERRKHRSDRHGERSRHSGERSTNVGERNNSSDGLHSHSGQRSRKSRKESRKNRKSHREGETEGERDEMKSASNSCNSPPAALPYINPTTTTTAAAAAAAAAAVVATQPASVMAPTSPLMIQLNTPNRPVLQPISPDLAALSNSSVLLLPTTTPTSTTVGTSSSPMPFKTVLPVLPQSKLFQNSPSASPAPSPPATDLQLPVTTFPTTYLNLPANAHQSTFLDTLSTSSTQDYLNADEFSLQKNLQELTEQTMTSQSTAPASPISGPNPPFYQSAFSSSLELESVMFDVEGRTLSSRVEPPTFMRSILDYNSKHSHKVSEGVSRKTPAERGSLRRSTSNTVHNNPAIIKAASATTSGTTSPIPAIKKNFMTVPLNQLNVSLSHSAPASVSSSPPSFAFGAGAEPEPSSFPGASFIPYARAGLGLTSSSSCLLPPSHYNVKENVIYSSQATQALKLLESMQNNNFSSFDLVSSSSSTAINVNNNNLSARRLRRGHSDGSVTQLPTTPAPLERQSSASRIVPQSPSVATEPQDLISPHPRSNPTSPRTQTRSSSSNSAASAVNSPNDASFLAWSNKTPSLPTVIHCVDKPASTEAPTSSSTSTTTTTTPSASDTPLVLLYDVSRLSARLLSNTLSSFGMEVHVCRSMQAAVEIARKTKFNYIILDGMQRTIHNLHSGHTESETILPSPIQFVHSVLAEQAEEDDDKLTPSSSTTSKTRPVFVSLVSKLDDTLLSLFQSNGVHFIVEQAAIFKNALSCIFQIMQERSSEPMADGECYAIDCNHFIYKFDKSVDPSVPVKVSDLRNVTPRAARAESVGAVHFHETEAESEQLQADEKNGALAADATGPAFNIRVTGERGSLVLN